MSLRDRAAAQHDELIEADAALAEENLQRVRDKRARQADCSGESTAVPPEKTGV